MSAEDRHEARQAALKEAHERERQRCELYFRVFTTEDGKAVLADIERECYVGHTTATRPSEGAPIDATHTLLCEGERRAALRIRSYVNRAKQPPPEPQRHAHSESVERKETP